jgi:SlyX protein
LHTEPDDRDPRLEILETKISYQEATIQDLSQSLYEQKNQIERLEKLVKELASKFKEFAGEGLSPLPPNERPPHY